MIKIFVFKILLYFIYSYTGKDIVSFKVDVLQTTKKSHDYVDRRTQK